MNAKWIRSSEPLCGQGKDGRKGKDELPIACVWGGRCSVVRPYGVLGWACLVLRKSHRTVRLEKPSQLTQPTPTNHIPQCHFPMALQHLHSPVQWEPVLRRDAEAMIVALK